MGCTCSCDSDYDSSNFYRNAIHKSKKWRRCCECGDIILSGEKYEYSVYGGPGINTYHTCLSCARIRDSILDGGCIVGEMWENIRECIGEEALPNRLRHDNDEELGLYRYLLNWR
jgi:hypothetical protein